MTDKLITLFILAIPIACIAWTVTHEEIFLELRDYCKKKSEQSISIFEKKFFYVFTCEYCFSHYVTILMLLLTGYKLLFDDWRGYLVSGFSLVWIGNTYMNLYGVLRIDIKKERIQTEKEEKKLDET